MNNNILDDEKQLEYINKKLVKFLEKRLDILNKNKSIDSLLIDKKIIDELYEWFGIGNDREIFVQVFETYLLCDERFEEIFGKEKCCELSALIATYGK